MVLEQLSARKVRIVTKLGVRVATVRAWWQRLA